MKQSLVFITVRRKYIEIRGTSNHVGVVGNKRTIEYSRHVSQGVLAIACVISGKRTTPQPDPPKQWFPFFRKTSHDFLLSLLQFFWRRSAGCWSAGQLCLHDARRNFELVRYCAILARDTYSMNQDIQKSNYLAVVQEPYCFDKEVVVKT